MAAGAVFSGPPTKANAVTTDTFVSDMAPTSQSNGWGAASVDRSLDGNPLTLAGKTYEKGWGTNAYSSLTYQLNGQYSTFSSDVGIDDEVASNGRVQFKVVGDGRELWRSTEMTGDSATQTVNVSVASVTTLELVVDDLGSINHDHGDWAGAKITGPANPIVGFYATRDGSKKTFETRSTVAFGTSQADALATLPTEGFSLFRDGSYFPIRVTWNFDEQYDATVTGDKKVTATIESGSNGGTTMASTKGTVTVLPQSSLPAPWSDARIGDSSTGDASHNNGTFTVAGSGSDIWNRASGFHYAFQRYTGDVQIVARLDSITDTDDWAKAGLMISDGLDANAKFASLLVTPRQVLGLERRLTVGGETDWVGGFRNSSALPLYLKLSRTADRFDAATSTDGVVWSEAGSVDISMNATAYIGLAVTSHNINRTNTAKFSNVAVGAAATDKNALTSSIELGSRLLDQTAIGTSIGTVTQASVNVLRNAVTAAEVTAADPDADQQRINAVADDLGTAITVFQSSTTQSASRPFISNKDMNNSGTSTVGDLGIASAFTGDASVRARIADVNNSGAVEADDLRGIANNIAENRTIAFTPPMGWNSWDVYANTVNEQQLRDHTDYMAKNLKQYGWQYVVNDIQWYNPQANGSYDMRAPSMDQYGRLIPAENRFPSSAGGAGFRPLSDYVHSKGLKFGIHIMRGVPRAAVDARLPIKNSPYTVDQIANRNSWAAWNGDMWGIDATKPGAQEYVDSLLQMYADWGVDFIKIDDLSAPTYHQSEVDLYRTAIDKTGRDMVLSTSPGNTPISAGPHVQENANMWRMSNDFWDNWPAMVEMYHLTEQWTPFRGPGHWPDADMIPIGKLEIRTDPNTGAERDGRTTRFSRDEQISLMTLWSMAKSPLILGNDLRVLDGDSWTKSLITNRAVLNINQNSTDNKLLYRTGDLLAWTAKSPEGSTYLSHANLTSKNTVMATTLSQLGLPTSKSYAVYDLWSDSYLGVVTGEDSVISSVPTHGARLLQIVDLDEKADWAETPTATSPFVSEVASAPSAQGPSLTLTGKGERAVGSQVSVTVGAQQLAASTAQEIVVKYDSKALKLGGVTPSDNTAVLNVDSSSPGEVAVLLSNSSGISGAAALANIAFTVTGANPSASATATVATKEGREFIANAATTISWVAAPEQSPKVSATASTRCVASKAVVVVQVNNLDSRTFGATIVTGYGTKSVSTLEPGKGTSQVISTRASVIPAGSADVTASISGGGSTTVKASYPERSCR